MIHFAIILQSGGLTLQKIVADIPHDAGAVLAYLLIGGMIFLTWFGSRKTTVERYSSRTATWPGAAEADVWLTPVDESVREPDAEPVAPAAALTPRPRNSRPKRSSRRPGAINWVI